MWTPVFRKRPRAALTLSDASCVDRQFDELQQFIPQHVDILLANDREAETLFQSDDLDEIADKARKMCPLTAVTLSEKGSMLIPRDGDVVKVDAVNPKNLWTPQALATPMPRDCYTVWRAALSWKALGHSARWPQAR